jgi:multimeric flavodoxin WrbA
MLIITASPRKNSNSTAAALFLAGLSGAKYGTVDVNRLKIHPCNACGKCSIAGDCVFYDGGALLMEKVKKARAVIVASPIYFTGVPAPLKAFIDRNQAVWSLYHAGKIKKAEKKDGIIVLTEGHSKPKYFKPAESEIRAFFAVNGIKTVAVVKLKNMDEAGTALKKSANRAKLKKAALLMGAK